MKLKDRYAEKSKLMEEKANLMDEKSKQGKTDGREEVTKDYFPSSC